MKHITYAILCIIALIAETNAQGLYLSPSFSYWGTAVITTTAESTEIITDSRYGLEIDVTSGLFSFTSVAMRGNVVTEFYALASASDETEYIVTNGVCSVSAFIEDELDPANLTNFRTNFWSFLVNAVENPPDTYIVTFSNVVTTIVTADGLPTLLSTIITGPTSTSFVITINTYTNSTPPFSTFSLPTACNEFTCNSCYSSAMNLGNNLIIMLLALAVMYSMM